MKSRIEVIRGSHPIVFVVPHGPDDINTAAIGAHLANKWDCNAVINHGFRRADFVDVENDLADCNRIDHIKSDEVVEEEFLKPIMKIRNKFIPYGYAAFNSMNDHAVTLFHIHGCGNHIQKRALTGYPISFILGYGLGVKKHSYSTLLWKKNFIRNNWNHSKVSYGYAYEGVGNGDYAGRSTNNLNQYFRKHENDLGVDSMQIEIPFDMRKDSKSWNSFAYHFGELIEYFILSINDKNNEIEYKNTEYSELMV